VVLLFAAFLVIAHYRAKWSLEAYRKRLIAQGKKLSIAQLVPPAPTDGLNGAPALMAVRLNSLNYDFYPSVMKMLSSGRARVAWTQEVEPSEKSTNIWPALHTQMKNNSDALAEIRQILTNYALHFDLNYQQGFKLLLPHLTQLKSISQWLSLATVMELHEDNASAAFDNLQAFIALPFLYRDEPMMISQLVRIAMGSIALAATWEALQFRGWTDDQLAQLQRAWEGYKPREIMEQTLGMECGMGRLIFEDARISYYKKDALWGFRTPSTNSVVGDLKDARDELISDPVEGLRNLYQRFPHYWAWKWWWSYDEELCSMQLWQAGIEAAQLAGKSHSFEAAVAQHEAQRHRLEQAYPHADARFIFLVNIEKHHLTGFLKKVATAETQREMVITAIALKRHQLRTGKYPSALAELVPLNLRELPLDWMDGQPLRYRVQENGAFLLYSVGENRTDDGGDPSVASDSFSFSFWRGKDAVWPMPATAEEIDADNAAMEKKKPRFGVDGQMSQELRTRYGLTRATNTPATNNLK
jgi:hypothetical protein